MPPPPWPELFAAAEAARLRAYAPYSGFRVGAALWLDDGSTVGGCNVENASYGLTVCAERNAVAAMVLSGRRARALALVADSEAPTPPCGACRQVLAEHAEGSLEVRSRTLSGGQEGRWTLEGLLPHAFSRSFL